MNIYIASYSIGLVRQIGKEAPYHTKVVTHPQELVWWRTFMVEYVTILRALLIKTHCYIIHHESSPPYELFGL